ncbi:MAG: zf-HC2 domain-containing protein [bacterium]|nr:zf-HC2 domain-containing protein [bacterium]
MRHLSQAELVLYQGKIGLSSAQKKMVADHLLICDQCRIKLSELQNDTKRMSKDNLKACQQFQNSLASYIDGELDARNATTIKEHLNECDRCQHLYQLAVDLPDWEDLATAAVEIPVSVQEKIEGAVFHAIKKDTLKAPTKRASEKIASAIEDMVTELILSFRPIIPATVFRGESLDELKVIEHPGGDLHLETGLKNVTLALTSIFEEFSVQGQTDEHGEIVFKNLARGEYVASVSGYRLAGVKIKKQPEK